MDAKGMDRDKVADVTDSVSLDQGYCFLQQAVDMATVQRLGVACENAFTEQTEEVRPRSSRGHVYAARNLIDGVPEVRMFWRSGVLADFLRRQLGDGFGLVRVLFFDKPPDRSWALPWHKDTAIAVADNSIVSGSFSRPTLKAGVPHVVACDEVLGRMLTLRLHLDDVTDENGPLRLIPSSHVSSTSEGAGVDAAVTIHACVGDVLAMRPLITHASRASVEGTTRHRRILHLEFSADRTLPDGFQWHEFVGGSDVDRCPVSWPSPNSTSLLMNIDREQIEANLRQHVDRLAGLIGARHLKRPKTIQATIGYIEGQWDEMAYAIERETYDALGDEATNLIVTRPGSKRPDKIVVLGAHYDTVSATPGADDNASAVAVLLEVSRLLREHQGQRTARFVAFACEEPPYFNLDSMGSQHHARESRTRDDDIVGMLCLEMVGYYQLSKGSQQIPPAIPKLLHPVFPKRGNFLAAVGNLRSWKLCWTFRRGFKRGTRRMPLFSIVLPEQIGEIRLSDNASFWDQGYPALMLTDTSYLRNPNYHLESDTPETLDYARMTEVTLGVAAAMRKLLR